MNLKGTMSTLTSFSSFKACMNLPCGSLMTLKCTSPACLTHQGRIQESAKSLSAMTYHMVSTKRSSLRDTIHSTQIKKMSHAAKTSIDSLSGRILTSSSTLDTTPSQSRRPAGSISPISMESRCLALSSSSSGAIPNPLEKRPK